MMLGSVQRTVQTAAEASVAVHQIRNAGGSSIVITNDAGRVITPEELSVLAPAQTVLVVEISILEARKDIRLVFTDIDMPGTMDGLKLAHYVRDRWPPIHLLLVSGKSIIDETALPIGARFLAKPYGTAHVTAAIQQLLASP
jgi:CheY-like chemotaxis protein